jgi:hypothetical protein
MLFLQQRVEQLMSEVSEQLAKSRGPIIAGRLRAPVVIVVLAVLAALAVFLKQYR